jgi:transposase
MSLHPQEIPPIPEETARVARAILPQGNRYLLLREGLGTIYSDELFADVYPRLGQPAEQPWRLALVTVMQFMENYTDRQAAEAVRTRIDWKYVLSLELTDPGFNFSVLSEFRTRLLESEQGERLLTALLQECQARGWLKARGKQRTDSTHVLAAIRTINRLECAGETLRAALNDLAVVAPDWMRSQVPAEWHERYDSRIEEYQLPKEATKRQAMAEQIGADGWHLLSAINGSQAPAWLREIPAVEVLRRVWIQQFYVSEDHVHWRADDNIPPASLLISSPYDPEAHLSIKRSTVWTGYKVHVTETCDEDSPHLLIQIETTPATTQDKEVTADIHQELESLHLLPNEHFADTGYVDGDQLVSSQLEYGIDLVGPVTVDPSWQAKAGQGYDATQFTIDWQARQVTCPQGKTSRKWKLAHDRRYPAVIRVEFGRADCLACPCRSLCTSAASNPRQLTLRSVHTPSTKPFKPHVSVRRRPPSKSAIVCEPGSKERSRKAFGPLACARPAIWAKPRRICNT